VAIGADCGGAVCACALHAHITERTTIAKEIEVNLM
jgi:hypothetical protein